MIISELQIFSQKKIFFCDLYYKSLYLCIIKIKTHKVMTNARITTASACASVNCTNGFVAISNLRHRQCADGTWHAICVTNHSNAVRFCNDPIGSAFWHAISGMTRMRNLNL